MSDAELNVKQSKRAFDAFSRQDLDGVTDLLDPEIEWHVAFPLPDLPSAKEVYRGREEVREVLRAFWSAWSELRIEQEAVLHADDERLLLRVRFVGRGLESGIEVDRPLFYAYRARDGLLRYSRAHDTEAAARADLGLEPS